jgi:hypothetical protein
MSWVNDMASVLGIPAGAATLAVSMYAGCSAAEKAAGRTGDGWIVGVDVVSCEQDNER